MPELPEVETTIKDLQIKVLNRTFIDVWTNFGRMIKKPRSFKKFKKELKEKKIKKIWRRGKNIIIELSQGYSLLMHQKMTGHLLYGKWEQKKGRWISQIKGVLEDRENDYIHLMFFLDNKKMLAFCDLRKFGKVELWKTEELKNSKELKKLGIEPLGKNFTFRKFKETILKKKKGKIKQVLMNQEVIAGIGNIYSDEILWGAKINPFKDISKLKVAELKKIYRAVRKILEKAIKLKGSSVSDFRDTQGKKGKFDKMLKIYRKEGQKCPRCGAIIQKAKIAGRTVHFCPRCQKK